MSKIVSTFLPAEPAMGLERKVSLFAFRTRVDDKELFVGITVGQLGEKRTLDDIKVTPIGDLIIERVYKHAGKDPEREIRFIGVTKKSEAKKFVTFHLESAKDNGIVIILCKDSNVYDKAVKGLRVDYSSMR